MYFWSAFLEKLGIKHFQVSQDKTKRVTSSHTGAVNDAKIVSYKSDNWFSVKFLAPADI